MSLFVMAVGKPFIPGWVELRPFMAELCLIATIIAVLLSAFKSRRSNLTAAMVTLAGLLAALLGIVMAGTGGVEPGHQGMQLLLNDHVAFFWKILLLIFAVGIVLMWFSTSASTMHEGDGPEFFTLLLGATTGMCLMASTSNLLMLVMAIEMASLPSYVLAGFRKTNRIGAEASLKYVLFGAATSAIMIYGVSLLYGLYGTLQLAGPQGIAAQMAASGGSAVLAVALFGLIVGVGFKVSAVPFHFWCPDVFEGASIDVSAFLSVASKGAALVLLLRVVMIVGDAFSFHGAPVPHSLAVVIGILVAVTCTVGNTGAFVQTNIKRLLAYSSIAHAGYMLCALSLLVKGAGAHSQFDPAAGAAQAILLYLAVYLFVNLGAFTTAGLVARETGSESIDEYAGMSKRSVILALCMALFMFSLVGLPPLAGFVAKVYVLWALIQNGGWWWALVAVIGVNTVLSLYYYLRVVKTMYLDSPGERPSFFGQPLGVAISVGSAAVLVLMFVGFGPMTRWTGHFARIHSVKHTGNVVIVPAEAGNPSTPALSNATVPYDTAETRSAHAR